MLSQQIKNEYTKYQVAEIHFIVWRKTAFSGRDGCNISGKDELDYIKENIQEEYNLTNEDVKNIFDEHAEPCYWDIEEDKVKNRLQEEEEEEEEED